MNEMSFPADREVRADVFLSERAGVTRSAVKKLADAGNLFVNGKRSKAGQILKIGDTVRAVVPDPVSAEAKPEDIPVEIVYEDDWLAVVNKAQGMTVHAGAGNYDGTLVNALLYRLGSLSGINGTIRPGIVHRLDKDTSGLLVVAKNDEAHVNLSAQIADKTCRREYLALVEGVVKENEGRIVTSFGRDPGNRLKMSVNPSGRGRHAETYFSVVERFLRNTLVRFCLKTGRTHQIRVHAAYLHHPVVGDKLYGYRTQRFKLAGQLLHAERLEFTHPRTGERMSFTAPLPDYFRNVLETVRKEGLQEET